MVPCAPFAAAAAAAAAVIVVIAAGSAPTATRDERLEKPIAAAGAQLNLGEPAEQRVADCQCCDTEQHLWTVGPVQQQGDRQHFLAPGREVHRPLPLPWPANLPLSSTQRLEEVLDSRLSCSRAGTAELSCRWWADLRRVYFLPEPVDLIRTAP